MGEQIKFGGSKVSDQKRLVRGEQLLAARSLLRARDEVHHRKWRILIMAGGAPRGEVAAIRELMPKAYILAVDNNPACLDAAIEAGVDDVVECDLTDWTLNTSPGVNGSETAHSRQHIGIARQLQGMPPFDIVSLDLCGSVNETTRQIYKTYRAITTPGGIVLLTFSYGRDVTEMFQRSLKEMKYLSKNGMSESQQERRVRVLNRLQGAGVPDLLAGRLYYLFTPTELERVKSVMVYRGNEMPMCSVMYASGHPVDGLSFVQIEHGDFELAVAYPDAANLYDCPQERIESLRRKFAAIKASLTRTERAASASVLPFEAEKS